MKNKAKQQLMQKKPKELTTLVAKKREEIAQAILKGTEEKNKNMIRNLQYEIALMLTALREQEIASESPGGDTHE